MAHGPSPAVDVETQRPDDELNLGAPLLPVPVALWPRTKKIKERPGETHCKAPPAPRAPGPLPFGPGERMTYAVRYFGFRTGSIHIQLGESVWLDGQRVYPIDGRVRTERMMSVLGAVEGRMVSYLDVGRARPVRSVNRYKIGRAFGPDTTQREDLWFLDDNRVRGRLVRRVGQGRQKTRHHLRQAHRDVVDVLSTLYFARSRQVEAGHDSCFEVYHRRSLYRIEAHPKETRTISGPAGPTAARRIDVEVYRVARRSHAPVVATIWLSQDAHRNLLRVEVPLTVGTLEVVLLQYAPGRRLLRKPRTSTPPG